MGAHSSRRAKRAHLLLVELGIAFAATACGTNDARPEATSGIVTAQPSGAAPMAEVMRLFDYDRQRPLAVTKLGGTTDRLPAQALDGISVEAITYASPKGGEVPALVVVPKGRGPFAGVIVQHGLPSTKEDFLRLGVDLARTGAVAILIDAPFNRPQQGRVRGDKIIGATLTPARGTAFGLYGTPETDARRRAVNEFIRNSGLFDGVADFAAVTEDPANPGRLLPAYDTNTSVGGPGDHLHPNRAGFLAMGHAINLAQLKRLVARAERSSDPVSVLP